MFLRDIDRDPNHNNNDTNSALLMVVVGWGSGTILGRGKIGFNENVTLYDPDGSVHVRTMNPDGGFYDAQEQLYEDDGSFHLSDVGLDNSENTINDDGVFLDALEQQLTRQEDSYRDDHGALRPDNLETGGDGGGDASDSFPKNSSE